MQEIALLVAFALVLLAITVFLVRRKKHSKTVVGNDTAIDENNAAELAKLRELDARISGLVARTRRTLEQKGIPTEFLEILASSLAHLLRIQDQLQPQISSAHLQLLNDATLTKAAIKQAAKLTQQFEIVAGETEIALKRIHEFEAARILDALGGD